jgi:hypothetical protein
MQLRSRPYAVVATAALTAALTLVLAACSSSSTGPTTPTPQQIATHFDSMYSALLAQGTPMDSEIADLLAIAGELPPAYGAPQGSTIVTTASGTQAWNGFTFEVANTGVDGDSSFVTFLYKDLSLSQAIVAETNYNVCGNTGGEAFAITNLTTGGGDSTYSGSATVASTGSAACTLQSGLAAGPAIVNQFGTYACQPATFQVSFQATFFGDENLGALSTVSVSNASFSGVRLYQAVTASTVARIPSRLAAVGARLRALTAEAHRLH